MNVAIYQPSIPEGWYFLGHMAATMPGSYSDDSSIVRQLAPYAIVVQSDDPTALSSVTPSQRLWTDQHSGGDQNIEIWSFTATQTGAPCVALGLFASIVQHYGTDPTGNPAWANLRMVQQEYLMQVDMVGSEIWNDHHSGADGNGIWRDISLWGLVANVGISLGTFVAAEGYPASPTSTIPSPWALNPKKTKYTGKYPTWMQSSTNIQGKKLQNICLPATHDSGTYALTNTVSPDPSKELQKVLNNLSSVADKISAIPGVGQYIPNPAEWVVEQAIPAIKALATATSRTIRQQLEDGIRCLDLRIYYQQSDQQFYTFHGLVGSKVSTILNDVQNFLAATSGEIVYITMGHFQGFGDDQYLDFAEIVVTALGEYAYIRTMDAPGNITNDPFQQTYQAIVSVSESRVTSKVILVYGESADMKNDPVLSKYPIFWPSYYSPSDNGSSDTEAIYGFYTNTTQKDHMLSEQAKNQAKAVSLNLPFALYMTLTPSTEDAVKRVVFTLASPIAKVAAPLLLNPLSAPIGSAPEALAGGLAIADKVLSWHSLEELEKPVTRSLSPYVMGDFVPTGPISIVYLDFYEHTDVVDLAIQLSNMA